jgi:hypothetical protein
MLSITLHSGARPPVEGNTVEAEVGLDKADIHLHPLFFPVRGKLYS